MSISQKEQGLRRRIGTEKLIGCFTTDKDGKTYFADIRGEEGDRSTVDGIDNWIIPYNGVGLKD